MDADLAFDASTITYSPDPDGNILSMADNTGTTSYGYDALNRIVAKTLPGQPTNCSATAGSVTTSGTISGTICYSYDDDSKLTAYQDGGGQVQYGYNTLDEVTTLTEPGGAQTIFGYDNNHRRTTTTYPVNVTQTVTYDASGRISNIQASSGATTLTNFGYSYINPTTSQDSGLVYSITDGVLNTTTAQSFDTLNRLLEWKVTPNAGSTAAPHDYLYHYDGNGNRTYISADGAVSNLTYNAANEWVQDVAGGKTDTISWDTAGNETGDDGFGGTSIPLVITYNAKNQTATQTGCTTTTVPAGG
ncbi:MAG TPA: hypothetical protein VFZ25_02675, partial [Chloroflexota bacterium]|nr:hypothetical protein [Chloroflexota bacterium]